LDLTFLLVFFKNKYISRISTFKYHYMKYFFYLYVILTILGCKSNDENNQTSNDLPAVINEQSNPTLLQESKNKVNDTLVSKEFVIRFNELYNKKQKDSALGEILGDKVKLEKSATCPCYNDEYLLAEITGDSAEIESAKQRMSSTSGQEGVRGEPNYNFDLPKSVPEYPFPSADSNGELLVSKLTTANGNTIAILDTGINLNRFDENFPYLFDRMQLSPCDDGSDFDLDFVDRKKNFFDAHGHGTYVAKILVDELKGKVPFRILPLKVFDTTGKASYWNLLCALKSINRLNKGNRKIDFVNMSFGYSYKNDNNNSDDFFQEESLIKKEIDLLNNTLFVASSGNQSVNTDDKEHLHYPSGFDSKNLIAVGGYTISKNSIIRNAANYGPERIDVAGPYTKIVLFADGHKAELSGTSFATPFVTTKMVKLYSKNVYSSNEFIAKFLETETGCVIQDANLQGFTKRGNYVPEK